MISSLAIDAERPCAVLADNIILTAPCHLHCRSIQMLIMTAVSSSSNSNRWSQYAHKYGDVDIISLFLSICQLFRPP